LGRRITETTVDGNWTYTYDATGQLTRAVFASTNVALPNQDLEYDYDPAGNRTRTALNGVPTHYVTNSVNEYTRVGTTTYTYDADGNQVAKTDATGTTTWTYNDENRLVKMTAPDETSTYQYDALGDRVAVTGNGQRADYLIDPTGLGEVVGEYSGS